ncbi:MAG: hypothetical protein IKR49_10235 [Clostridia bacterium]|nr:hypothetical protein [Clostridia bacterium]
MKMKMTRILALAAAALLAATMASCAGKTDTEDTTAADTTAAVETAADDTTAAQSILTDDTTEAAPTEADATQEVQTEAVETTKEAETTVTTTEAPTTTEAAPKAPTDKAEILKLYNDATAKVAQKKVAFSKRRETKEGKYEAGVALNAFKSIVYKFMGIGAENVYTKDVAKGDGDYNHYFQASKLTTSDVSDATCTLGSDGSYSITINVKSGSSHIAGGSGETLNAPLDKSGISAGRDDKGYWDHKTAQNVYDAIDDVASGAVIDESYSNAVVKATVDKDGNLTKLDVSFDIKFDIEKVYGSTGHATGTTIVNFSGFKW